MEIKNESSRVSDEAVEKAVEKLEVANEILKEIKLRKGEVDVRELSPKDLIQAQYRFMNDMLTLGNYMVQSLSDITIVLLESLSQNKKKKVLDALNGTGKKQEQPKQETKIEDEDPTKILGGSI
jgi:hypothetical protein